MDMDGWMDGYGQYILRYGFDVLLIAEPRKGSSFQKCFCP